VCKHALGFLYNPTLQVQGSGFLYKQVRHMTGALLALGEGRIGLQDIAARLEVGNNQPPGALPIITAYLHNSSASQAVRCRSCLAMANHRQYTGNVHLDFSLSTVGLYCSAVLFSCTVQPFV
jgi:hypothetical protein